MLGLLNYAKNYASTIRRQKPNYDWSDVYGLILLLGIKGVYDGYKQQERKTMTEASASVCLLLATANRTLRGYSLSLTE